MTTTHRDVDQAGHHEEVVGVGQRVLAVGGRARYSSFVWARILRYQYGSGRVAAEAAASGHESNKQRVGGGAGHPLRPAVPIHLYLLCDCLGHGVPQDGDRRKLGWWKCRRFSNSTK